MFIIEIAPFTHQKSLSILILLLLVVLLVLIVFLVILLILVIVLAVVLVVLVEVHSFHLLKIAMCIVYLFCEKLYTGGIFYAFNTKRYTLYYGRRKTFLR